MRHLTSGEDCAIAGEATAATAAPVAETFRKSRRFIKTLLVGPFPIFLEHFRRQSAFPLQPQVRSGGGFNTEVRFAKTRQTHDSTRLNESRIRPASRLRR